MYNLQIRQELPSDYKEVEQVIELAFQEEVYSDHKEHLLVSRLRDSEAFVPQLSLVAVLDHTIVGYTLLTKVTTIRNHPR